MSQDTLLMEWKSRKQTLANCPAVEHPDRYKELREYEEYMESKGFAIDYNMVIDPQGEVVWKRD